MKSIEAVRKLRRHLGESQQAFATRLGLSIRAVANYEKDREPRGRAAAALGRAAVEAGREDLAAIFRKSLWADMNNSALIVSDSQRTWINILLDILEARQHSSLKPICESAQQSLEAAARQIIQAAVGTDDLGLQELAHNTGGHLLVAAAQKLRDEHNDGKAQVRGDRRTK